MPDKFKGPEIPPELLKVLKEHARKEIEPLLASFFGGVLKEVLEDESLKTRDELLDALANRVQPALDYATEIAHGDASPERLKVAYTKAEFQKWLNEQRKK